MNPPRSQVISTVTSIVGNNTRYELKNISITNQFIDHALTCEHCSTMLESFYDNIVEGRE